MLEPLRAEIAALCRDIAPDLAGLPLYPLFASELPPEHAGDAWGGYHHPALDAVLAGFLGDRWAGRGVAFVVNDRRQADRAAAVLLGFAAVGLAEHPPEDHYFRRYALAVAVHELAHAIGEGPLTLADMEPARAACIGESLAAQDPAALIPANRPLPFQDHEWRYVRALAHLAFRAGRAGAPFTAADTFDHAAYWLSPLGEYQAALHVELRTMQTLPLAAVAATPPPYPFAALWRRDFAAWFTANDSHPEAMAAVQCRARSLFIPGL